MPAKKKDDGMEFLSIVRFATLGDGVIPVAFAAAKMPLLKAAEQAKVDLSRIAKIKVRRGGEGIIVNDARTFEVQDGDEVFMMPKVSGG